MPILMPTPVPAGSPPCIQVPEFRNQCHSLHPGATASFIFKTSAFDRSATPPGHIVAPARSHPRRSMTRTFLGGSNQETDCERSRRHPAVRRLWGIGRLAERHIRSGWLLGPRSGTAAGQVPPRRHGSGGNATGCVRLRGPQLASLNHPRSSCASRPVTTSARLTPVLPLSRVP